MSFIQNVAFDAVAVADVTTVWLQPSEEIAVIDSAADSASDIELVLLEVAGGLVDAFAEDGVSLRGYACLDALDPDSAKRTHELLIQAVSPDGGGVAGSLGDAATIVVAGLLTAAGCGPAALNVLDHPSTGGRNAGFRHAAFVARCRALGLTGVADLWLSAARVSTVPEAALAAVSARELDVEAHRVLVRSFAEHGRHDDAIAAICTAMSLPLGQGERMPLAADLASLVTILCATGQEGLLEKSRVKLALKASPSIAMRAMALLGSTDQRLVKAAGREVTMMAADFLHRFSNPVDIAVRSPYPIRNGKPHIDIVWLEITNFCNQKCTFCPDMFREDSRQWLPLAEVKRLIDELAETISVGSMQLNAYGEPLLHPNIQEILTYIREKQLPWPTFFTSHGMTLVPKKLAQLSHNYPAGIALSLHNDSQESYEATRSAKIGDYDTLVTRVSDLLRQMANEGAPCHMRLYQMVSNGNEDLRVDPKVRSAFPDTPERMIAHVRKWEAIAREIAAQAPPESQVRALVTEAHVITEAYAAASHGDGHHIRILEWCDVNGVTQHAFMSARPVGTYANLLLEHHPDWAVDRKVVNANVCGFVNAPALAIFATRKLGICCLDMDSTGTFGSLDDYPTLVDAVTSPEAARMFAQVANGVATSKGCQICLGEGRNLCAS